MAALPVPRRAAWGAPAAAGRALVPREVFFGNPDVAWVRLSPDGAWLAYIAPVGGVRNVWVAPLGDLAAARPITHVTARPIGGYFQWAFTNRHIVFFEEHDGDENWRASSVDIRDGRIVPLTPARGVRAYVQEVSRRFPRAVLLGHNARDKELFDLYRVDVVTGRSELLYENHWFADLFTDSAFELRLGSRFLEDGSLEWVERRRNGAWRAFFNGGSPTAATRC
jgi:hypothetical protein